jgi:hypothetical protein
VAVPSKQKTSAGEADEPQEEAARTLSIRSMSPWLTLYALLAGSLVAWLAPRYPPIVQWAPWALIAGLTLSLVGVSDSFVPIVFAALSILLWGAATQWSDVPTVDPALALVFVYFSGGGVVTGMFMTLGKSYEIRPGAIVASKGLFRGHETIHAKAAGTTLLPRGPRQWLLNCGDVQLDLGGRKLILKDVFAPWSVEAKIRQQG